MFKAKLVSIFLICHCIFAVEAQNPMPDCIYTKANFYPVTLKVIDKTGQKISNPEGGYHGKNIYTWLDPELKVQNPRTPNHWWYPMYPEANVTPTGTVTQNDSIVEWSIILQATPGNYEWNPGANSLGKHFINPGMFEWEGGNLRFSVAPDGTISGTTEIVIVTLPYKGTPYHKTPFVIPGLIQAEDFDLGGEGVAYHDQEKGHPGGSKPVYRVNEDVEVENDGKNDGYHVGWTTGGEWLKYTMDVIKSGIYDIVYTTANANSSKCKLSIDDKLLGEYAVPNTGSYSVYKNSTIQNITLQKGIQVLTLSVNSGNFDKIEFILVEETGIQPVWESGRIFVENKVLHIEGFQALTSLSIYNLLGQKVVHYDGIHENLQINLRPQIYIIRMNRNGNSITQKVLIQ
jgi:hypothetical protein